MSTAVVADIDAAAWERMVGAAMRSTLSHLGVGIYCYDGAQHKFFMDETCRALFGIPPDEVFGPDTIRRYLHPDDVEYYRRGIATQMASGGATILDYRIVRPDGAVRRITNRGYVQSGPDGGPIRITGFCIDVTQQRDMEERLRGTEDRMRHLADSVPGLYAYLDSELVVRFVSATYEASHGRPIRELVNRPLADNIGPEHFARLLPHFRRALAGETVSYDEARTHADGSEHYYAVTYQPDRDASGTVRGVISLAMDITERRRMEEALERKSAELLRSNTELEQFAYVASHDLKAPLRAVEMLVDWIAEDLGGYEKGDVQENLGLLRKRANRLHRLLDDLLAYSRAGRRPGDISDVNTHEMVQDLFVLLAPSSGMQLTADASLPVIRAYQAPLEQVLRNLIQNAIKHHPTGTGCVRVSAADTGDEVLFAVEDDGAGIAAEFVARVFDMFQTLKPRDEVEGSGMGLAIVKRLVEWQGGRVWLHPAPGGTGTVFKFTWRKLPPDPALAGSDEGHDGQASDRQYLAG